MALGRSPSGGPHHAGHALGDLRPRRETGCLRHGGLTLDASQRGAANRPLERVSQRLDVTRLEQTAVLTLVDQLDVASPRGGEHRKAAGHGLQDFAGGGERHTMAHVEAVLALVVDGMQHQATLPFDGAADQHEVRRQLDGGGYVQALQQVRHGQALDGPVQRQPHGVLIVVGADQDQRAFEARV